MESYYKPEEGLDVDFYSRFISRKRGNLILSKCDALDWQSLKRRSNIIFGNEGLVYSVTFYNSGHPKTLDRHVRPWSDFPELIPIKKRIEKKTGSICNFCAVMRYPDGNIVIKKHRDREMIHGTSIFGLSVGSVRKFKLSKAFKQDITLNLTHGSLYAIKPPTNDSWFHEILPDPDISEVRYSLTFRTL